MPRTPALLIRKSIPSLCDLCTVSTAAWKKPESCGFRCLRCGPPAVAAYSHDTWTVFESDKSKGTANSRPANRWLNLCKSSAFSGDLAPAITVVFGTSSICRGAHACTHCVEVLLSLLSQPANRVDKVLAYLLHKLEPNASIRAGNNPHCACHLAESCE